MQFINEIKGGNIPKEFIPYYGHYGPFFIRMACEAKSKLNEKVPKYTMIQENMIQGCLIWSLKLVWDI